MQMLRGGESRRFELPVKVDRRVAIIIALAVLAGVAGHLTYQILAPRRAVASQPRPSTLAMDSLPAIYLTPQPSPTTKSVQSIPPDIDIQPHVTRRERKRRQPEQPRQPDVSKPKETPAREEDTQSVERIDSEEGTIFVPKRKDDEEPPEQHSFNGLDD